MTVQQLLKKDTVLIGGELELLVSARRVLPLAIFFQGQGALLAFHAAITHRVVERGCIREVEWLWRKYYQHSHGHSLTS